MTTSVSNSPRPTIGTHDGAFHCDEALACYMLRQTSCFAGAAITRSRDAEVLAVADIVVDVGATYDPRAMRFDHHQRGFGETFEDAGTGKRCRTKLSSAGLIYKHFGREVVRAILAANGVELEASDLECVYLKVYDAFIEAIDAVDNGIAQFETALPARYESRTDLSSRVGRLNAPWNEPDSDQEKNFAAAMQLAGKEFADAVVDIAKHWLPARSIVAKAMDERMRYDERGRILVMNEWAPWKDHLYTLEDEEDRAEKVLYVVYKDMTGSTYRAQAVPVASGSFISRLPFPESWRGIRNSDLSTLIDISQCVFVHASGFIGGNKTFEGALEMAQKSIALAEKAEQE